MQWLVANAEMNAEAEAQRIQLLRLQLKSPTAAKRLAEAEAVRNANRKAAEEEKSRAESNSPAKLLKKRE